MATRLYGVLLDGLKKPIVNATVVLLAKGNTITVLNGSEAIFKTDAQGAYNVTVQTGYYKVIIGPQGIEPYKAGEIAIYADSPEGSLNSYLVNWAEEDLTPEVIKQVKELVAISEQYSLQAGRSAAAAQADATDARNSKASAAQSASDALVYKNDSKTNADAAKQAQAGASGSANTASAALTTIQGIQKDVTASKNRAVTAETNAKSSENVATQAKTDAVTAKEQAVAAKDKAQQIADSIDPQSIKNSIGLGVERRYLSDLTKPFSDVGFFMINSSTIGYPSVADQSAMSGYVARQDGSPSYTGLFVDPGHGHAYTMTQFNNVATFRQLTFSADVDRIKQLSSGTRVYGGPQDERYFEIHTGAWGVYNVTEKRWLPLAIQQGGTGAVTADDALKNIGGFKMQRSSIGTANLNDFTGSKCGVYFQNSIANATKDRNYPINSAGVLLVYITFANGAESCVQEYIEYRYGTKFIRTYDVGNNTWTEWKQFVVAGQKITFAGVTTRGQDTTSSSFVSQVTNSSGATIGQFEARADTTGNASLIVRDLSGSNSRFYTLNLNGSFDAPEGYALKTTSDWNALLNVNAASFKMVSGPTNSPVETVNYGGFHLSFSGNYGVQFAGRNNDYMLRGIEAGEYSDWNRIIVGTKAKYIPLDSRDGFISDNDGNTTWAPSNGGGFQASYAENRIMQGWVDGAGRLYGRFLTSDQATTPKTDVAWKSSAMLEMDNRFTGTNTFIGDVVCSAANPLRLRSANPTISFVESDASGSTYLFVADGGNFRLNRDTTAGAELFSYSRSQNNLKLGVSSYFTLNTRFDQGWTSKGSVDVTTTGYSTVSVITTTSTDAVGARNQFEVNPSTNQFYLARRNRSNLTGQWIINFPSAGGTLALSGTSDINYKTNIEDYDGLHSVENIKAMELVTFVFKDDEKKRVRRGVIAQQIEQIDPTYVKRTYEPCGEAIVDEDGVVQGYSEEKERVVLDNNVILLDCLCATKVLIQKDEQKTEEINKLKEEIVQLKSLIDNLLLQVGKSTNSSDLP